MAKKGFLPQIDLLGIIPGKTSVLIGESYLSYEVIDHIEADLDLSIHPCESYEPDDFEEVDLSEKASDLSIEFYDMNGIAVLKSPQILQLSDSLPIELPIASEFFDMAFEAEGSITIQAPQAIMFSEGYRDSAGLWHVEYDRLLDLGFHYDGDAKAFEIEMTTNLTTDSGSTQSMSHIIMVNVDTIMAYHETFIPLTNQCDSAILGEYAADIKYQSMADIDTYALDLTMVHTSHFYSEDALRMRTKRKKRTKQMENTHDYEDA